MDERDLFPLQKLVSAKEKDEELGASMMQELFLRWRRRRLAKSVITDFCLVCNHKNNSNILLQIANKSLRVTRYIYRPRPNGRQRVLQIQTYLHSVIIQIQTKI